MLMEEIMKRENTITIGEAINSLGPEALKEFRLKCDEKIKRSHGIRKMPTSAKTDRVQTIIFETIVGMYNDLVNIDKYADEDKAETVCNLLFSMRAIIFSIMGNCSLEELDDYFTENLRCLDIEKLYEIATK